MEQINAIGRRKSSVARVYLTEGTGKIVINKRELDKYFPSGILQYVVKQPLQLLGVEEKYDIKANLDGGFHRSEPGSAHGYRPCTGEDQCRGQEGPEGPRIPHPRCSRG